MRGKVVLGVVSMIAVVSIGLSVLLLNATPVALYRQTFTLQVNQEVPTDVGYYVKASDSILEKCTLYIEEVDNKIIAVYPAYVICDNQRYDFQIMVEDTQKPIIELKSNSALISCYIGQTFLAGDLVNVQDDTLTTVYFEDQEATIQQESVTLKKTGNFDYYIVAKDSAGNVSRRQRVRFEVGTDTSKPTITGVNDVVLKVGDSFDLLEGVQAVDNADGDITSMIVVSPKEISTANAGQYTITYSVTDTSGNTTTEKRIVTITDSGTTGKNDVGDGPFLTESQINERDNIVQSLLSNELDEFSDYRFVESLNKYLMGNFTVSSSGSDNTSYVALVRYKGNRMAMVRAVKVLLDAKGIENTIVYGKNSSLAWNMVKIDNEYRHLDVFANLVYDDEDYCFLVKTSDLPNGYDYETNLYPNADN